MESLSEPHAAWPGWAKILHRYGLVDLAGWVLEAVGPLRVLAAQALYIGGPLLRPAMTDNQFDALVGLLEDSDEARAFSTFLRKGISL